MRKLLLERYPRLTKSQRQLYKVVENYRRIKKRSGKAVKQFMETAMKGYDEGFQPPVITLPRETHEKTQEQLKSTEKRLKNARRSLGDTRKMLLNKSKELDDTSRVKSELERLVAARSLRNCQQQIQI